MSSPTPTDNSSSKSFSEELEIIQATFASFRLDNSSAATEEETPIFPSTPLPTSIQSHHSDTKHPTPHRIFIRSLAQQIQDQASLQLEFRVFLSDKGTVVMQQSRARDMTERDSEAERKEEEEFEKEFERKLKEAERGSETKRKEEEEFEKEFERKLENGKKRFEELRKAMKTAQQTGAEY